MTRLACCITSALLLTALASSHADARNHYRGDTAVTPGARNQAAPTDRPQSDMAVRQQCYEQAAKQVSSTNQDLQTVRNYVYKNCAFDHGLQP
jgi:hypothetical protein